MKLKECLEGLKFDTRLIDWNKKNGVISDADVKSHLDKLQDLSSQADSFSFASTLEDSGEPEGHNESLNGHPSESFAQPQQPNGGFDPQGSGFQ